MSEVNAVPKDKLLADLRAVVADAEALLRLASAGPGDAAAGAATGPAASDLWARIEAHLGAARAGVLGAQQAAVDQARAAGRAADDYVHAKPWQAVGIAAGLGLLLGLLISRR